MAAKAGKKRQNHAKSGDEIEPPPVDQPLVGEALPADATPGRRSKRQRTSPTAEAPVEASAVATCEATNEPACAACGSSQTSVTDKLLQCGSCALLVHGSCYNTDSAPASISSDPLAASVWKCDMCHHQNEDENAHSSSLPKCVYCLQPGDAFMRRVDTKHWPSMHRQETTSAQAWGHVMCAAWDPFLSDSDSKQVQEPSPPPPLPTTESDLELSTTQASGDKDIQSTSSGSTLMSDLSSSSRVVLPVPACYCCDSAKGVRVQCHHLHCGKFFHVKCAQTHPSTARIEVLHVPFPQRHAYCDRHHHKRHGLEDLVAKLSAKTITSAMPRDISAKILSLTRRIESFASVDAFLQEVSALLVELCKRGRANSKTDPPRYPMKHLQILQLVLDHLPQLRKVYSLATLSKSESELVLHDAELMHALQKAFHPQRFVRKFAGPVSQFHHCDLCREPFHEQQHVFYCTASPQPHALHWKCTKRKAQAKEPRNGNGTSAKKKRKSVALVQQGQWKDVKLPKSLPGVSDSVACGVCRAPVDVRAIIASRKQATKTEFEKPTSTFLFGGCFANEMDAKSAAVAGLATSRASVASSHKASASAAAGAKSGSSRRASGIGATGGGGSEFDTEAPVAMGPPKMERINVRRTTRWLACLAQVIRLVLAARKEAQEVATKVLDNEQNCEPEDAAVSDKTTAVAGPSSDSTPTTTEHQDDDNDEAGSRARSEDHAVDGGDLAEAAAEEDGDGNARIETETAQTTEDVAMEEDADAAAMDPTANIVETSGPATANGDEPMMKEETPPASSTLPPLALAYLEEAKNVVRPFDVYAWTTMETAHRMLEARKGPGLSLLHSLIQDYTRFMYIKHTRAVEKATNEKRKLHEQHLLEEHERERKRVDREAEQALKKQMLAMRKKQRQ